MARSFFNTAITNLKLEMKDFLGMNSFPLQLITIANKWRSMLWSRGLSLCNLTAMDQALSICLTISNRSVFSEIRIKKPLFFIIGSPF